MSPSRVELACDGDHWWFSFAPEHVENMQPDRGWPRRLNCPDHDGCPSNGPDPLTQFYRDRE